MTTMDSPSIKRILEALETQGPMTDAEIVSKAFVALGSFQGKYKTTLLDAERIHISEYRRNPRGGWPIAVYALGPGEKVARKPEKISKTESNNRWLAKRAIPKHDRVLNALMGRAA